MVGACYRDAGDRGVVERVHLSVNTHHLPISQLCPDPVLARVLQRPKILENPRNPKGNMSAWLISVFWPCMMMLRACIARIYQAFLTMSAVLHQILATLQRSTSIPPEIPDKKLRFWTTYKDIAGDFDAEFLLKYDGDMDTCMIFVSGSFL